MCTTFHSVPELIENCSGSSLITAYFNIGINRAIHWNFVLGTEYSDGSYTAEFDAPTSTPGKKFHLIATGNTTKDSRRYSVS